MPWSNSGVSKAVLVWGNQLTIEHNSALKAEPDAPVIIIESEAMCRKFRYHKQKLLFILTAMREYGDELSETGRTVVYRKIGEADSNWFKTLEIVCRDKGITNLTAMRQNDHAPQDRLSTWCSRNDIKLATTPNTLFLTPTAEFNEWADGQKRLQMEQFYHWQRRRLNILMVGEKPVGGSWNYDSENRQALPKNPDLPAISFPGPSKHAADIRELIEDRFADHPGSIDINWLPTTRKQSLDWLQAFIAERFELFGAYEDAMQKNETFLYHSALSALLNIGLLHAEEVVAVAIKADVPLASKEGFIRQVIGWREFMFGLYNYKPDDWKTANFLQHTKKLPDWWWRLKDTPEPPLTDVLARLDAYGYSHHIERLMVIGNYMLLAGYHPREAYDWFMTMYVDAYDWVMVPNVIGMSQYADGGLDNGGFATKPYVSGSNYLQKMGRWWPTAQAAKDSDWASAYWDFLERHEDKLSQNHRLRPLYATVRRRKG